MKRVLIFAYEFPPYNSIATQRPHSWFTYFQHYGWHPVIVTRHWNPDTFTQTDYVTPSKQREVITEEHPSGTIIRVPFTPNLRDRLQIRWGLNRMQPLRLLLTFFYAVAEHFSFRFDRDSALYFAANKYCRNNKVDMILATGNPFITFRYASLIGKTFGIPYALDYRDGWTTHENFSSQHPVFRFLLTHVLARFEKLYVKKAALLTVASPSYIPKLQALHPAATFNTVYNGFMKEDFEGLQNITQSNEQFIIGYGGTVYEFQRLDIFLDGLNDFIHRTGFTNIKVRFVGIKYYPQQYKRVKTYKPDLLPYLEFTDRLPHREALQKLKECNVLLLLANRNNALLASKIYDYLMLDRKIMLVENDHGVLKSILTQTNSGISCENAAEVSACLEELSNQHRHQHFIPGTSSNIDFFDRKNQAAIFCNLITKAAS